MPFLAFFGTIWGQLAVQVITGAASAGIQYVSGHDFGAQNGTIQAVAGFGAELLAMASGGQPTVSQAVAQAKK